MATVRMEAGFRPGTEVKLVKRLSHEHHVSGAVAATGTVDDNSVLEIDVRDPGTYHAISEDQGTMQVTAKGDEDDSIKENTGDVVDPPDAEEVIYAPPPQAEVMTDADSGDREVARGPGAGAKVDEPSGDDGDDGRTVRGARTTASTRRTPRSPRS